MTVEVRYAHAAKKHLEKKYEEEFFVEQFANDPRDMLLPHITFPPTSYFYAYPLSDPDHVVEVYITKSEFSYRITEITDTYYFKFLRVQLQEYVHQEFKDVLGDEMKVNISLNGEGFSNTLNHNSTLDDFFAESIADVDDNKYRYSLDITIYVPTYDDGNLEKILKQRDQFSLQMLQQYKVFGDIGALHVKDRETYNLIDVSQDFTWRDQDEIFGEEENIDLLEAIFYRFYFVDAAEQKPEGVEGDE